MGCAFSNFHLLDQHCNQRYVMLYCFRWLWRKQSTGWTCLPLRSSNKPIIVNMKQSSLFRQKSTKSRNSRYSQSVCLSVCLSVYRSIDRSNCLLIHASMHPSIKYNLPFQCFSSPWFMPLFYIFSSVFF